MQRKYLVAMSERQIEEAELKYSERLNMLAYIWIKSDYGSITAIDVNEIDEIQ